MTTTTAIVPAASVKIERERRKTVQIDADKELISVLVRSPAVQILVSYLIIEILQKNQVIGGAWTDFEEGAVMTAITSAVIAQQLAPILPDLLKAGGDVAAALAGVIGKLGMAVAAGGGA